MIETQLYISVNRKTDLEKIKEILMLSKIESPVYIAEYGQHFGINFRSQHEEWQIDTRICESFPGYELTTDLHRGKKEIRLEISRYQSELCTTKWGSPIDNPLNETKYLIKKTVETPITFSPEVRVLFGSIEKTYYINIISGIKESTDEKGFLLAKEFKNQADPKTADFFPDRLYKTQLEAFHRGKDRLESIVDEDHKEILVLQKKEKLQREKIPRKIIREFIKNCNASNYDSIIKDLSQNFQFEIRVEWRQKLSTSGLDEFKNYLEAAYQELCERDFKIKSSWSFLKQDVGVNLETFTPPQETEEDLKRLYKIRLNFRLEEEKIIQIILEK
ncbi:hypothetical protein [Chryseobacterium rhizosphaerae]|uniref:CYTH domain-containing protein n=1 Tax=Chryseobacterium rhizosphaerae TaxID=395937 RepID=A0ABX9INQ9_9FLAO|nr:hypothetical protein [Chryseobacterium rhizosphaerae]REC77024.1 hypothetical protein DRF57_06450 [Chryseobacterium rhizosphaerae]GEN68556.1 hypothetical protein CRH01_31240 [Chryseobacterium rhizosphaerae]